MKEELNINQKNAVLKLIFQYPDLYKLNDSRFPADKKAEMLLKLINEGIIENPYDFMVSFVIEQAGLKFNHKGLAINSIKFSKPMYHLVNILYKKSLRGHFDEIEYSNRKEDKNSMSLEKIQKSYRIAPNELKIEIKEKAGYKSNSVERLRYRVPLSKLVSDTKSKLRNNGIPYTIEGNRKLGYALQKTSI